MNGRDRCLLKLYTNITTYLIPDLFEKVFGYIDISEQYFTTEEYVTKRCGICGNIQKIYDPICKIPRDHIRDFYYGYEDSEGYIMFIVRGDIIWTYTCTIDDFIVRETTYTLSKYKRTYYSNETEIEYLMRDYHITTKSYDSEDEYYQDYEIYGIMKEKSLTLKLQNAVIICKAFLCDELCSYTRFIHSNTTCEEFLSVL